MANREGKSGEQERILCPKCNGTGMEKCWSCHGRGMHYGDTPSGYIGPPIRATCDVCYGQGRKGTCPECWGKGFVSKGE